MKFKDYKAMLHKEERIINRIQMNDMKLNGADELVDINDIIIPGNFNLTKPRRVKIIRAYEYFNKIGYFDKPISVVAEVNERGKPNRLILIDEYSRYIAAKWLHMKFVPVKYIDINDVVIE